jgi:hypothetical protein
MWCASMDIDGTDALNVRSVLRATIERVALVSLAMCCARREKEGEIPHRGWAGWAIFSA